MSYHTYSNQRGSALIIGLIVAAVIVVGGVTAYFVTDGFGSNDSDDTQNSASTQQSPNSSQTQPQTATTKSQVGTMFADVVAGKYDVKCSFDDGTNTGTIYYSASGSDNVKMRFDTTSADYDGHVLRVDNTVYTWTDGQDTGTKLTVKPTAGDEKYSVDKYENDPGKYNLTCKNAGTLDASVFAVPSGVKFMDIGQYSGEAMGSAGAQ